MKSDVFISYSSKDKDVAFILCEALENEGIICWIAPRDVKAGHYATSIVEGIESSKLFVLLFSQNSNDSTPVLNELEMAMSSKLLIVPARIEEILPSKAMKFYLMATNWFDTLDAKSIDDFKGFVSVVKNNLNIEEEPLVKHSFSPLKKEKKKNIFQIFLISIILVIISLLVIFYFQNNLKKNIENKENLIPQILIDKLIEQTTQTEHWKQEYFKLKEKYKDYPNLISQAEKIKDETGYKEAVNFYMKIKKDKLSHSIKSTNSHRENNSSMDFDLKEKKENSTKLYRGLGVVENFGITSKELIELHPKKALLIGNYNYEKVEKLSNPSTNINKLAKTLIDLGFDITIKKNLTKEEMHQAIENFSKELSKDNNSISFFYYSGHGYQVEKENYLIPIDMNIKETNAIRYKAVNITEILKGLASSKNSLNMFFLDISTEKNIPSIPQNTVLMFASNGLAEDNTIFIDALIKEIRKPVNINMIINRIRQKVADITGYEQIPLVVSNTISDIILNKSPIEFLNIYSHNKIEVSVTNVTTNQEKRIFCKGERLRVKIKDIKKMPYLIILSADKDGKICLLKPDNKQPINSDYIIETEVVPPYGKDYLKFFALTNQAQYDEVLELSKQFPVDGILDKKAIEKLYQILIFDKNFREQEVQIETIPMDKEKCYESVFR